ncbi:hypothetical protein SKAU_G00157390 [Synaphobranchus kaupii]|uniref:Uncharacterized protein n=1 Tax=Synaphobranchus kaupii TaxID=118154 RepID=A0A9Q1FI78_SYNKA|nr:hypothetical protein SKAU_G00157390 [Synaphobranchus kaupii]
MARHDLGSGFDGWQVLDPTPQERSDGIFCCGPSPVKGIKNRHLDLIYDVPFVYAEVNADVHMVIMKNGQALSRIVDKERVGSVICTKSLGSALPQNLTNAYKNAKAVMPSNRTTNGSQGSRRANIHPGGKQTLALSLSLDKTPVAGETILFSVTVTNKENFPKNLNEHINAQAKEYNSRPLESFWEVHNMLQLAPYEVKTIVHRITHSEYEEMLLGDGLVNLAVVMQDMASHERVLATEEFNITNPLISILITGNDYIVMNEKREAHFVFRNPFHIPMSGVLTVRGAGLLQGRVQSNVNLQPGETMEETVSFTPKATGTKMLHTNLIFKNSPIVIRGFTTVLVKVA